MMDINKVKYLMWVLGVIVWNFGVLAAKPIYDIAMALVLRHIVDIDKLLIR